jgi:hypothetical protein
MNSNEKQPTPLLSKTSPSSVETDVRPANLEGLEWTLLLEDGLARGYCGTKIMFTLGEKYRETAKNIIERVNASLSARPVTTEESGIKDAPSDRVEHVRQNALHFVFDVESIGLHGEAFAVAGGLYTLDNAALWEFRACCPTQECAGTDSDRKWILENVPQMDITHRTPRGIRDEFWKRWQGAKFQGARMAADCSWPVEAKFLEACIQDDELGRNWEGPYPLIDIGSVLLGAGYDPMKDYERTANELPKHEPLADARQSARLLAMALKTPSVSDRSRARAASVSSSNPAPSVSSGVGATEDLGGKDA